MKLTTNMIVNIPTGDVKKSNTFLNGMNLDKISTGEMFRAQKNLYKGSKPVGYPKGGLINITQKLADYITNNGGKINLGTSVGKIVIENNKATGVMVGDENYKFDIVISNILVQDLFKIADVNSKIISKEEINCRT